MLKGTSVVIRNIQSHGRRIPKASVRALNEAAKKVEESAKQHATSDTVRGAIFTFKPSLTVRRITVRPGVFLTRRIAKSKKSGRRYHPDEASRFFRFLELGTKYTPAKPFLGPAEEEAKRSFKGDLARGIRTQLS